MMEVMDESRDNIVGIRASRKLTVADYNGVLVPRLETMVREFGSIRVLFYMDADFQGWELSAAWTNTRLDIRHRGDLEKVAIVGAPAWEEWCVKLAAGAVMKGALRTFDADRLQLAWDWLRS